MSRPQCDALDDTLGAATDVNGVAYAELVFRNDKETADEVAHHGLSSKTQRNADDASCRKQRAEADAQNFERKEQGDKPDQRCTNRAEYRSKRFKTSVGANRRISRRKEHFRCATTQGPLASSLRGIAGQKQTIHRTRNHPTNNHCYKASDNDHAEDCKRLGDEPFRGASPRL